MKLRAESRHASPPTVQFTFEDGEQAIDANTTVTGFAVVAVELTQETDGGITHRQTQTDPETGREITVIERFRLTSMGVRWETEVWTDSEQPFTAPVTSEIR